MILHKKVSGTEIGLENFHPSVRLFEHNNTCCKFPPTFWYVVQWEERAPIKLDERLISARAQPHSSAIYSHGTYFCFCTRSNIASLLFQSSKPIGPDCSVGRRWKSYRTALLGRWRSHRLVNNWASIESFPAANLVFGKSYSRLPLSSFQKNYNFTIEIEQFWTGCRMQSRPILV